MKKSLIVSALFVSSLLVLSSCGGSGTAFEEQKQTEANQSHLNKVQPPVKLNWSLERDNINKRTKLWNDKNKVSYIYLISYGNIMAFYTVRGKVSYVDSAVTNPQQVVKVKPGEYRVLPSPAEDGSYNSNGNAIFFFTAEGAYIEWNDKYQLSDVPMKMSKPPLLTRAIQ